MPRKKSPAQLDREIAEVLASRKQSPQDEVIELLLQRDPDAADVARDRLLEHGVMKTGRVDSVREVGLHYGGRTYQVGIVMHGRGERLGSNDPKRFWTSMSAPTVGSAVDFTSTKEDPPTGPSANSPKQRLHVFNIEHLSRMPESVIREWVARWWR